MTEGLSEGRINRTVTADVNSLPSAHMALKANKLLDHLDQVYLEDERHAGYHREQQVKIMCHIMLHLYGYGLSDGEDRAINRLVKVMQGVRN